MERQTKRASEPDNSDDCGIRPVKLRLTSFQDANTFEKNMSVVSFCYRESGISGMHELSTMMMEQTIRMYATEFKDTKPLAKLASGDMLALEAKSREFFV